MPEERKPGATSFWRRLPWSAVVTAASILIAIGSLLYAKRSDDRSAANEAELRQVSFRIATASLDSSKQFGARVGVPKARLAVTVSMVNTSLRGVIVRRAQLRLDGRPVGCAVGWALPSQFAAMRFNTRRPREIAQPLPLPINARSAVTTVLVFVAEPKSLFPACAATPRFWRLAKDDLQTLAARVGQRSLRLWLELVPGGRKSISINVFFTTPDLSLPKAPGVPRPRHATTQPVSGPAAPAQ